MTVAGSALPTGQASVLQAGALVASVPWWLPGAVIGVGLISYGATQVDEFVAHRLPEWTVLPLPARLAVLGLFVGGAGLVALVRLGRFDWTYVLFLLGYARAVEGTTVVYLLGRLDEAMRRLVGTGGGGSLASKLRDLGAWWLGKLKKRIPLVVVTVVLSVISVGLYVTVIVGFPGMVLTAKVALALTLSTFYFSTVNTAWTLTKLSDSIRPASFLGLTACVVGGELYNVPSALRVFAGLPAVDGPLGAVTTLAVGTVGWFLGLLLGAAFFVRRVRERRPPR